MGGTQWIPPMALPCPPSAGVTDTCLAFKWVLGIQKESSCFVQQTFYLLSHLLNSTPHPARPPLYLSVDAVSLLLFSQQQMFQTSVIPSKFLQLLKDAFAHISFQEALLFPYLSSQWQGGIPDLRMDASVYFCSLSLALPSQKPGSLSARALFPTYSELNFLRQHIHCLLPFSMLSSVHLLARKEFSKVM